jgi:hypothetical protein
MPTIDHSISLEEAISMTTTYRTNYENILKDEYQQQNILPISETFDKDILKAFLENEECKSVRIYYGMDENLKVHAILVGANADNEDMLPSDSSGAPLYENGVRCPPVCPPSSVLNTD